MYVDLHEKCGCYFCPILNEIRMCRQIFSRRLKYDISRKAAKWEPRCCARTDIARPSLESRSRFPNASL